MSLSKPGWKISVLAPFDTVRANGFLSVRAEPVEAHAAHVDKPGASGQPEAARASGLSRGLNPR
jgi:hypothetical protein